MTGTKTRRERRGAGRRGGSEGEDAEMALVNHKLENFLRYGSEAREGKGQRNGRSTEKKKNEGKYLLLVALVTEDVL